MTDGDQEVSQGAGSVRPEGEKRDLTMRPPGLSGLARRKCPDEIWTLAEADYFAGATAVEVSARYGMAARTVYAHMRGRGKRAPENRKGNRPENKQENRREKTPEKEPEKEKEKETGRQSPAPSGVERDARPRVAPLSAHEMAALVRDVFAEACAGAADRLRARPIATDTRKIKDGEIQTRFLYAEETWEQMRRDYVEGGYTAARIAERYGISQSTIEGRASREGWTKRIAPEIPPLKAVDDPAQVAPGEDGKDRSAWETIAHGAQLPPASTAGGAPWRTWLFQGGRGAGKTRAGAEWLAGLAEETPRGIFAIVGATESDVRRVMIEGPSGLLNLPGRKALHYEPSLKKITWRENGAVAHVFSAEEPDRLRGPQFMAAWADEFAAWPKAEYTLAMLRMGLRLKRDGASPQLVITTTPRPIPSLRKLHAEASCAVTTAPTSANADHLHKDFLVGLGDIYGGTRLERQELMGELLEGEGALWRREWIVQGERPKKFDRVVVAVDPPASTGGVCGIVVAARLGTRAFVLEDASIAGASPAGWARRVAETAGRHGAHRIVVETNQGGDMVSAVLAVEDPPCPIRKVRAHLSKSARAEPIAALYEKGRITHCGAFSALEEEMMALGSDEEARLDRVDALVWALTDLLIVKRPRPGMIRY